MSEHRIDELGGLPAPTPPPISPDLETELAKLAPTRMRDPARQRAVLIGVSFAYAMGLVYVLTMRVDFGELPMAWTAGVMLGWLFGFLVPCYLALTPRPGTMTPRWQAAAIAAAIASVGFVALGLAVHPSGESSARYGWEHFARGHTCLELGVLTALVPVVLGAIFLRRALPVGSRWIAAALGAGGGCLGGLVLHLHCHIADGPHIGLMHGGVVAVSALLSAALIPRATDVS